MSKTSNKLIVATIIATPVYTPVAMAFKKAVTK